MWLIPNDRDTEDTISTLEFTLEVIEDDTPIDEDAVDEVLDLMEGELAGQPSRLAYGGVVGVAELVDVGESYSRWAASGSVHWQFSRAARVPLLEVKGRQGLFKVALGGDSRPQNSLTDSIDKMA